MKIHLIKDTNAVTIEGISLERMACERNPFLNGPTRDEKEFERILKEVPKLCCKKCIKIFNKRKENR